jgi:hypothetical protein
MKRVIASPHLPTAAATTASLTSPRGKKPCGTSGKSMVSVVGQRSFSVLYLRQQLNQSKVHHAREHEAARNSQSARVTIPVNVTVALAPQVRRHRHDTVLQKHLARHKKERAQYA